MVMKQKKEKEGGKIKIMDELASFVAISNRKHLNAMKERLLMMK